MAYTYRFARPALTVDAVVFGLDDHELKVLLIERDRAPFAGRWALPGGFVEVDESLEQAVARELREETGLENVELEQLASFGDVHRDPRERVVSIAYYALVQASACHLRAGDDARRAAWFAVGKTPKLAFDHRRIFAVARQRLRAKLCSQPIGLDLLPRKFTLRQLQRTYETVLGQTLDKRKFQSRIRKMDILVELAETESDVPHRAARLYRFDRRKYRRHVERGVIFEL